MMEEGFSLLDDSFVLPDNPDAPLCVGSSVRWNFDKGAVNDQGEVLRSCDPRFLTELLLRMERGYENVLQHLFVSDMDESSSVDEDLAAENPAISEELNAVSYDHRLNFDTISRAVNDTSTLFVEIAREIRRLQRYQDLFPNDYLMKTFLIYLKVKMATNHNIWAKIAKKSSNEHCWTRLEKSEYLVELWIKSPTYQYNLKPWQQFLNDGAPGSGINPKAKFLGKVPESDDFDFTEVTEDSNYQIIPPGGMVIWANWYNRINELERRIKRTIVPERFKCAQRGKAMMAAKREIKELTPMLFRRETIHFDFEPNVWKPHIPDREQIFPQDELHFFDIIIGHLEGETGIELDDDATNGVLVASEPSGQHSVLHHLF